MTRNAACVKRRGVITPKTEGKQKNGIHHFMKSKQVTTITKGLLRITEVVSIRERTVSVSFADAYESTLKCGLSKHASGAAFGLSDLYSAGVD